MGRPKGSNSNARERLLEAAGRGFRQGGFGGVGVDSLAKDAGLTSGAFYAHFSSKTDAFRATIDHGLRLLLDGVALFKDRHGPDWLEPFIEFYLGAQMEVPLSAACAMPSFALDAARADEAGRDAYQAGLLKVAEAVADGLQGPDARDRAWRLLAILTGGAAVARAVTDAGVRTEILKAAKAIAKAI